MEKSDDDNFVSAELFDSIREGNMEVISDNNVPQIEDELYEFANETNEARNYVAGYICKKFNIQGSSGKSSDSWISMKGDGKLVEPSKEIVDICAKCDDIFNTFHGQRINACFNPLGKLQCIILKKYPTFPPHIVKKYIKTKFFARIKQLNVKLKIDKQTKSVRSLKQMAQFVN